MVSLLASIDLNDLSVATHVLYRLIVSPRQCLAHPCMDPSRVNHVLSLILCLTIIHNLVACLSPWLAMDGHLCIYLVGALSMWRWGFLL